MTFRIFCLAIFLLVKFIYKELSNTASSKILIVKTYCEDQFFSDVLLSYLMYYF